MKDKVSLQQGHRYGGPFHSTGGKRTKAAACFVPVPGARERGSVFRGILLNRDFRGITSDDVDQRERKGTSSGRRSEGSEDATGYRSAPRHSSASAAVECDGLQVTITWDVEAPRDGDPAAVLYPKTLLRCPTIESKSPLLRAATIKIEWPRRGRRSRRVRRPAGAVCVLQGE